MAASLRSLVLVCVVGVVATWCFQTMGAAFLAPSSAGTVPMPQPVAEMWGSSLSTPHAGRHASVATAALGSAAPVVGRAELDDDWEDACKEYCEAICLTVSKTTACKNHCEQRDIHRPLYNHCGGETRP
mmetsp:Transcript_69182/g.136824  ORF Transcript_69182/g.136824 Transcript_69182/m.136824 type:complete len:129 (-) Transcript_69182:27-413(-)